MIRSRSEIRAARHEVNMTIAAVATAAWPCGLCHAPIGSPCTTTKSGLPIPSTCDAPGVHRDRVKKYLADKRGVQNRPAPTNSQPNPTGSVVMEKQEFVTITDLMGLYKVSRSTIYRRVEDGTLKAYRLGGRTIRFDAAEVEAAFRGVSA